MTDKPLPLNFIGKTDLKVTSLGFGAASLGNLFTSVNDNEAREAMTASLQAGINLYDTAPRYGLGLSEHRVGDALRMVPKSHYVLSTKVGRVLSANATANTNQPRYGFDTPMPFDASYDYTYDGIMRSYQDSMQRLGLASIDILLVHDIGAYTHGELNTYYYNQLQASGYKALEELRASGQIKAVGLGVNETEICEQVMSLGQFDCFLLAGRYSLLEQDAIDSFLPKCKAHGASIILGSPYNSGILATGVKGNNTPTYNYAPAPQAIVDKVAKIEATCEHYGVSLAAAALQFPLAHEVIATVVPGLGSAAKVERTLALYRQPIPAEFWQSLKQQGLLKAQVPVPTTDND